MPKVNRSVRLAIPMDDLQRVNVSVRAKLVSDKLDLSKIVRIDENRGRKVPALLFRCDLLIAAAVCDVLRANDRRAGENPTQVYVMRDRAWTRVTWNTLLTVQNEQGEIVLNPAVFGASANGEPKVIKGKVEPEAPQAAGNAVSKMRWGR